MMKLIPFYFRFLGFISPQFAAKSAFNIFLTPKKRKIGEKNKAVIEKAEISFVDYKNKKVALYKWWDKENKKTAFIIHGWESMASDFYKMILELKSGGYNVISFDAPSHGMSMGKKTNVNEFKEVFHLILSREKISTMDVIGHSLGGVASLLAVNEYDESLEVDKMILLATPSNISGRVKDFKKLLSLNQKSSFLLDSLIEKRITYPINELDSRILNKPINVNSLHLIYDEMDRVVSLKEGETFSENWKIPIEKVLKVGHFKMINNKEVLTNLRNMLKI